MKTILYNPIFINPQAYYVFPRLTRYLQPDNESTAEPANYIGTIEVKVIAYGDTTLKRTYTNTDSIDLSEFKNTWIRISLFTKVGSCVLGEWKIGNMESDLPYIDPEVLASLKAVVIVGNKTNNDSDRAIVKNLVDPDNPFVISNAAFKLNSGFGKYEQDFTDWRKSSKVTSFDSESIKFTSDVPWALLYYSSSIGEDIPSFKVRIKLYGESTLYYNYITQEGKYTSVAIKSEIFETPICYNTKYTGEKRVNVGFTLGVTLGECSGTITQIPSFEGAFVTDGIDDLITSTKTVQEMGITDEVTVVSMIHQIDLNSTYTIATTNYIENSNSREHVRSDVYNYGKTGIYGYSASLINNTKSDIKNILGDEADYYVKSTNSLQTIFDAKFSVVGRISELTEASQVAWYWTIIANKVLTTDQINQVIAYFNLDRTLNPDILCNTIKQGITNENHAEFGDKLIDYSGNGRDIQLNNIAWKGDSGIGKYEVDFLDSSIWNSSNSTITSSKIDCKNAIDHIMLLYYNVGSKEYPDIPSFKVIKTGADIDYSYIDETGFPKSVKIVDGENVLPVSHNTLYSGSDRFCGFGNPGMGNSVTITQIPSHAGGLCLDGINDFGKVTGMPIYKDYTVIADYERLKIGYIEDKGTPAILSKSYTAGQGAFLMNLIGSTGEHMNAYTFGNANSAIFNDLSKKIYYQSKYKMQGFDMTIGSGVDGDSLWLGAIRNNDSRFFNGAIYSLMSFPYSMSEFLIERQLKKYKLGTLYPDMVEFRPIVKSNNKWDTIEIWQGDKSLYRPTVNDDKTGIYLKKDSTIGIYVKPYVGQKVSEIVYNGVSYTDLKLNSNGFYYKVVPITKSPQKIGITIEQDENYILFNPVITSNVEYHKLDFYLNNYRKRINIGDYIPKGAYLRANFYLKNNVDELTVFTFNGVNINYRRSSVDDTAFNIGYIYNYDSPQEVNITIDEYIRYEDIVQPYPSVVKLENLDRTHTYTWGDKLKVGDTIRYNSSKNLLQGAYTLKGTLECNGVYVYDNNQQIVVTKEMVFAWSHSPIWAIDNNEPNCILSPRLLRIPNSSYKILGHIPDISGHGNHGVIHNSAYVEGSGVNEDGSYQFDGVDDFVTIPTTVGGKQILMRVNWEHSGAILYDQRGYVNEFAVCTGDLNIPDSIAYDGRNNGKTYIDGILNSNILSSQLGNITHNITITNELNSGVNTTNPRIGITTSGTNYGKFRFYDFMLFDDISTDDKIKELNEYVGIEAKVELPPYYWDAYGKTNLDADKATIQQRGVAVGDYDLTNHNHAYEGMSGYNGYPVVFGASKTWANESSGYVTSITSNTIHITNVLKAGLALLYSYVKYNGNLQNIKEIPPFKIEIKGLEGRSKFIYKYLATSDATKETNLYLGNGTHELPKSFLPTEALINNAVVGFSISPIEEGVTNFLSDITIEVLPEYENGLVYDGVEDYSVNTNIPALADYTYICKKTILNIPSNGATLLKGAHKTNGGAFIADYNNKWQFNFGQYNIIQSIPDGINWQTSSSFNGTSINRGTNTDDKGITIGRFSNGYANIVLYKLILYPKTIPLLQINFLKNLMERDEIIDLNNPIFIQE